MIWVCFLHFYQPPTQKKYWIDRITDEAYCRIVKGLLENPAAKITLNVNSLLLELWEQYGHQDVIEDLKTLVARGQLELTGSAKFHPLLPKLPREMIERQILLNELTLNKYFGVLPPGRRANRQQAIGHSQADLVPNDLMPNALPCLRGFFPPEMAYDRGLAQIVTDLGYEWIIAEELSLGGPVDYSKLYEVSGIIPNLGFIPQRGINPLRIFFRDRAFSYKILAGYLGTPQLFLDELSQRFPQDGPERYLLTAMDGETFGHHRPGMEKLLMDVFKTPGIELVHLSDLPDHFAKTESVETRPATWALMEHEVERNLPFARWDDPENEVHKLQWQLTNLAIASIGNSKFKPQITNQTQNSNLAQNLLDRALHSDQYWWASAKPWWSIEYIEKGAKELLEAVRATGDQVASDQAQKLYYQILETAFEYQRSGKVDQISKKEDETMRMRTDQALPQMPKEELLKIIEIINQEMVVVATNKEYERAAQLRDRIKELESYLSESTTN